LLKKGGRTVYFGNIGPNSKDIIAYFEKSGAAKCKPQDNPAEYILQIIGADATAKVDREWADVWEQNDDDKAAIEEILSIKAEYAGDAHEQDEIQGATGTYAISWSTQYKAVQRRVFQIYWRSPDYIKAKVLLNFVAGLSSVSPSTNKMHRCRCRACKISQYPSTVIE
jgi:hypothetical protein